MIKIGDTVKVYPHGSPDRASDGKVMVISGNQRSIAVAFSDKPKFTVALLGGLPIHRELGCLMLLATRMELQGVPWGPWVETFGGGHFEIEEIDASQ